MSGYSVARLDEIDEITDGRCPWRPVRHHFAITSFGVNAWTGRDAAVGGNPGQAYEPHGYEVWAPLKPLYEAGDYAAVADRGRESIEASRYPTPLYNLACCESLAGRTTDAIEHLRQAIALWDQFRSYAKEDSDFDPIRNEPAFKELVRA
jgi:hypothetical protein